MMANAAPSLLAWAAQRKSVRVRALARITDLATAVPSQDIHAAFIGWAAEQITGERERAVFKRMASRSGIEHRYSVLPLTASDGSPVDPGGFYSAAPLPSTGTRMTLYGEHAPMLALAAVRKLTASLEGITHIVVASCTGFVAPGIDQILARALGLSANVERLLIGYMGCYAAVTALRSARHIVVANPQARVLVVTVEISSLHLQEGGAIESLLAMLQFGDGAAAAIVEGQGKGIGIESGFSLALEDSADLIQWTIGDQGFAMVLSGEVPGRIATALAEPVVQAAICGDLSPTEIEGWAVHAGGRSILDAVEHGLALPPDSLSESRRTLARFGNMSSSTLMFTLAEMMANPPARGIALAFGPGLAAEGLRLVCADA
jgi:alpha-pyrone synthase